MEVIKSERNCPNPRAVKVFFVQNSLKVIIFSSNGQNSTTLFSKRKSKMTHQKRMALRNPIRKRSETHLQRLHYLRSPNVLKKYQIKWIKIPSLSESETEVFACENAQIRMKQQLSGVSQKFHNECVFVYSRWKLENLIKFDNTMQVCNYGFSYRSFALNHFRTYNKN